MPEQKPENKVVTFAKMAVVCVVCVGMIYGIVTLVAMLTS